MVKFVGLSFCLLFLNLTASAYEFGSDGRNGRDGYSGVSGSDARDISLILQGNSEYLDLAGGNGGDGSSGENGENAYSCYQPPRTSYNLNGADGGNGGDGGSGGRGGHGGDALLFVDNLSDLRRVQIFNNGGSGGYGASGGMGGYGCNCSVRSWSVQYCWNAEVCKDVRSCYDKRVRDENGKMVTKRECRTNRVCHPERQCRNDFYSCYDGSNGYSGNSKSRASSGRRGIIRVVKGLDSLPSENPSATISLKRASVEDTLLSKRIWSVKSGARSLFHANSDISDSYYNFEKLAQAFYGVEWKANRDISDFSNITVSGDFGGENIVIKPSKEIFYKGHEKQEGRVKLLVIEKAFKEEEIADLVLVKAAGMGKNYQAVIQDKRALNSEILTKLHVTLKYKKKIGGWVTVHQGLLAQNYIKMGETQIELELGKIALPKDADKIFKKKRRISIDIQVERTFGQRTKSVRLSKIDYRL